MKRPFTPAFKEGFFEALYEYLIITTPILIYLCLEAHHKNEWVYIITSPEWAIASIFLLLVSLIKYLHTLALIKMKPSVNIVGIIQLVIILIILAAIYNAKVSIDSETNTAIVLRIIIFFISSLIFFVFIIGKNLLKKD